MVAKGDSTTQQVSVASKVLSAEAERITCTFQDFEPYG